MKKILLTVVMAFIVMSCSNDDDVTIPQCAKPTNVTSSDITFESASINWDNISESRSYTLEYGLSGFSLGLGTVINSNNNSATINDLIEGTTYDVYVKTVCSDSNSSLYSSVITFTSTIPECPKPTNVTSSDITTESASINWDDMNESISYTLEYGISGFNLGTGTTINSTESNTTLNGLSSNTSYDVYIKSICSSTNNSMYSNISTFTTAAPLVVPQFLPNLSELNLFTGVLNDLTPSPYTFIYDLNTVLFTDYAHKQRIIALPPGTTMDYVDNGFPDFPNNTVIAKTFYYENDERDESLGKTIIETRILIKREGNWLLGNYKWNVDQTEAVLDDTTSNVLVEYIDNSGDTNNIEYVIPSAQQCIDCHSNNANITPIGPKLRTMNFNNQLQDFIAAGHLGNITDPTSIPTLPNWEDDSYTLEERSRAYFDINCAHCHSDGGFCQFQSLLRLSYETPFADSNIFERKASIDNRMQTYNNTYSMPLIGTTMVHDEGYTLIRQYLNTL